MPKVSRDLKLADDGVVTVGEAARFLQFHPTTVYRLMDGGVIAYLKIGRVRRIPRRALTTFVAARLRGGWNGA